MSTAPSRRLIRSYVRRPGRMTHAQRRGLKTLWFRYGIEPQGMLNLDRIFGRPAPKYVEVGFGMGDTLLAMATAYPQRDYLGIEVYEPGIGRVFNQLYSLGITNVRVIRADALQVFEHCIPERSLASVMVLFPDPWPKKRHRKRRLISNDFVALASEKLLPGGVLQLATDWEDYARHMLAVLEGEPRLANLAGPGRFAQRPADRPLTKFEIRGKALAHGVWDLLYQRRTA